MDTNQIRLKLQEFRAIQTADIILNGITVVAGENGAGKSTISQFLYYAFKISNEYEVLINNDLRGQLYDVHDFLERFNNDIIDQGKKTLFSMELNLPYSYDKEEAWIEAIDFFYTQYKQNIGYKAKVKSEDAFFRTYRLKKILADILADDYKSDNGSINIQDLSFSHMFQLLKNYIHKLFSLAKQKVKDRPSDLLENTLKRSFSTNRLPQEYEILEYGVPIISENNKIEEAHSVREIAYIDTPMLLGIKSNKYSYWNDTNNILKKFSQDIDDYSISSIISNDIIKGDVYYEDYGGSARINEQFIYKREDGSEFNLLDCATGVKSFAMLQMMLKSGFLNKYTLLIIDEPESHLHPQWIIEYARLLVLLNKHIGVKFFIASHNPDMVSAIKYISEKENIDKNLNFYIATPAKEKHSYKYIHLGTNIEPIFESFNIALDRINLYGTKNELNNEIL